MKRRVIITKKAFHTIRQCVLEADDNYETGGVLIGYNLWRMYLVVAITMPNTNSNTSRVSFLLDGAEHTRKVNDIVSGFRFSPAMLGIWHSHICDGHKFSKQDRLSNRILAKSLGGALSMLVTNSTHTIVCSISHISPTGIEEDCVVMVRTKAEMEVKSHEQR